MNTILSKFLPGNRAESEDKLNAPQPLSMGSLIDHQRRSVIGWLANHVGRLCAIPDCEEGLLIYSSLFSEYHLYDTEDINSYLMYLSYCLVDWIDEDKDVYSELKKMDLPNQLYDSFLKVYDENRDYLHFLKKEEPNNDKDSDHTIWEVYRDVLHASTQGKFLLILESELDSHLEGDVICNEPILERHDIPKSRESAKKAFELLGLPKSSISSYVLLISEMVTNVIKHAEDGSLKVLNSEDSVTVVVQDKGKGFPLKTLPYTILMEGYSTKKSLGQGFTLMMKLANKVLLQTSSNGSIIVLVFHKKK